LSTHARSDVTTSVARDLADLLDALSRVVHAADGGNTPYLHEKAQHLHETAQRLLRRLSLPANPELVHDATKYVDPARLRSLVTELALHYAAGRALYPTGGDPQVAASRHVLERVAADVAFTTEIPGLAPAVADAVAAWLRNRATSLGPDDPGPAPSAA
jgi:hypothetical protein